MFKYTFFIRTTSLESHRSQKSPLKARLRQTSYNDFILMRKGFLTLVGEPNESLRLITIYFTFKYSIGIKKTLPESLRSQNTPLKARFW